MAKNALLNPPPLSFFRNIIVEKEGEHKDAFDIKLRAMMPLADAARVLQLSHHQLGLQNTAKRFQWLAEQEPDLADLFGAAAMAYEIFMKTRAKYGLENHDSGRYIPVKKLNKLERQVLKNAFEPIAEIQKILEVRFQLNCFRG